MPKLSTNLSVFTALLVLGFLVFYPILGTGFFSDDYVVLRRISLGDFSQGSFFRPLSDLSLYVDQLIFGMNATGFHIVNVLLHVISAYLIYRILGTINVSGGMLNGNKQTIAIVSSLLFVVYPFHAEPVIWVVCRGVLLATLLTLLSCFIHLRLKGTIAGYIFPPLIFLLALTGYESVIIFPCILFFVERFVAKESAARSIRLVLPFLVSVGFYLLFRTWAVGNVIGSEKYFRTAGGATDWVMNFLRLVERSYIPPLENYFLAMWLAVTVLLAVVALLIVKRKSAQVGWLLLLTGIWLLSLLPAITVGINTHTSEGERFLYFPSAAFVISISIFLLKMFPGRQSFLLVMLVAAYFISYLQQTHANWRTSNSIVENILAGAAPATMKVKSYFIDVPEAYEGAFIFRNGFRQALELRHGINPDSVAIVSKLQLDKGWKPSNPLDSAGRKILNNEWVISKREDGGVIVSNRAGVTTLALLPGEMLFYFDGYTMKSFNW